MLGKNTPRSIRFLFLNGSARGASGNTQALIDHLAAGIREAGGRAEVVCLAEKNIQPCTGCFDCWNNPQSHCPIDDDVAPLLSRIQTTDVVVFATPIYLENLSGLLKHLLDRSLPLLDPFFERDEHGGYRHRRRMTAVPKMAVIATCGLPDMNQFQVVRLYFQRLANHWQTSIIAEIYRTQSELLLGDSFVLKPFVIPYFKILEQAGRELAQDGQLSLKTRQALERPLVPAGLYTSGANTYWGKLRGDEDQP